MTAGPPPAPASPPAWHDDDAAALGAGPLYPPAEVALLARQLIRPAAAAFQQIPAPGHGPLCAAVDGFLHAPAASTFLAAFRVLEQARRQAVIAGAGGGVLRRSFQQGVMAMRQVSSVPGPLVDVLAEHLPLDARAGDRLAALAALAQAYQEVSARVAADSDRRRRLWKNSSRRRPRR